VLRLRKGVVTAVDPLTVRVGTEERRAWADDGLVGQVRLGDEVIVNTDALDLELDSGGFDVVHANLSGDGGAEDESAGDDPVMKLNYTSLQHPVDPVELRDGGPDRRIPVLVLALHGQLAPAAWSAARAAADLRIGYVQTAGGALPGSLSMDVAQLRGAGLLCGHVTAGPSHGGELEAITVVGALRAASRSLGWDAVIAGPGPGIVGSGTDLGHGGMAALDTAHAALALGFETMLAPRMSSGDRRPRHHGLSHHTETVLELLLGSVRVPAPEIEHGLGPEGNGGERGALDRLREVCGDRHQIRMSEARLDEYAASGLPATTMGRELADDRLFFAAALAAGGALAASALVERVR
jgi:uncharacterized protein DUF3866